MPARRTASTLGTRRNGSHAAPAPAIVYPSSDGKPMAETETHLREMLRLFSTLDSAYADRPDVYVGANLLLYYEEGNPRASLAPDVFVVFDVPKLPRRDTYLLWHEGVPPALVIEVTSRTTRRADLGTKRDRYAAIGVGEYVLYDPRAPGLAYLDPPLQLHRLAGSAYQPVEPGPDGDLVSASTALRLRLVEGALRLLEADGTPLLDPSERAARAEARLAEVERRLAELERRDRERRPEGGQQR
jgi:Uma2 family endonuclease